MSSTMTNVVDASHPPPEETLVNNTLLYLLHSFNNFETEDESRRRIQVLGKIYQLFKDWCFQKILKYPGMNEEMSKSATCEIFTFGSYRLGVHSPGTDLDILCVSPRYIERKDFETDMYEVLKKQPSISKISAVFSAKVPVIKMIFDGVPIDLLFASLATYDRIPGDLLESLNDDAISRIDDDKTSFSLNGPRNTDMTLKLVPNLDNFRLTLRVVRLWAKRRGVYLNVLGFPGGFAWNIMVAKICQMYPNFLPSQLVRKFFKVYDMWDWNQAVFLRQVENLARSSAEPEVMMVMTPAHPSYNSTSTVNKHSIQAIREEFHLANRVIASIELGKASWNDLIEPIDFFAQFKHFLRVEVLAKTASDFDDWSGFVLSKLRILFYDNLGELKPSPYVRVLPEEQKIVDHEYSYSVAYYAGLKFFKQSTAEAGKSVDLRMPVLKFIELIFRLRRENKFELANCNLRVKYLEADQLVDEVRRMPNPSIKKRFRSFDDSIDPEKKAKLEEGKSNELMPEPVVTNVQVVNPVVGPQKKLVFNLKKK
jgi:poly(A) polymerase